MKIKKNIVLVFAVTIVIVGACMLFLARLKVRKEADKTTFSSISDVPKTYWAKLAETKIFFGHQSVGYNIIEGIRGIAAEYDYIKLNIVETKNSPSDFNLANAASNLAMFFFGSTELTQRTKSSGIPCLAMIFAVASAASMG